MSTESYIMLRKLTAKAGEPVEDILQRAASELRGMDEKATIELRVIPAKGSNVRATHCLMLTPGGVYLQSATNVANAADPTLVVITTPDAFQQMAEGTYSPVQAYLDRKLKLQGDVDLGRRVLTKLAGVGTRAEVCPFLINPVWRLHDFGHGSLTLSGRNFTPGGTVRLVYDYGGGFFPRLITADEDGSFILTESPFACGDIPGRPGVGVSVTANDISSGLSTTQNFATPC